jgi:hypothetical protein
MAIFYDCIYSIKGRKIIDGKRVKVEENDHVAPPNKWLTFEGDLVLWAYLNMEVRSPY